MSDDLREEQRFLLASLRDLERELAAGDIDEADYIALRDGYVARAAAITRELEGESQPVVVAKRSLLTKIVAVFVVLALGGGAGVFVAHSSGQRLPGQSASGGIEQSSASLLASARQLNFSNPTKAIEIYTQVLKTEPDNAEATTYRAWLIALTARTATGNIRTMAYAAVISDLLRAVNDDPTYPDPHCFLGIVYYRFLNDAKKSKPELDRCEAMNPPQEVAAFLNAIVAEVNKAVGK
jgi:tetratricopeptide (TPR) repeat protein